MQVFKTDWGQLSTFEQPGEMFGAKAWFSQTNFGCITQLNDTVVIAMRGTNTLEEWGVDSEIITKVEMHDWGHVHHGFYEVFQSVWKEIEEPLIQYAGKPVIVTGHSLGAAVATLVASELFIKNPHTNISLVTFGSPRVGDAAFVAAFNENIKKSLRIFNVMDLVPQLPPALFPGLLVPKYKHVNEPLSFSGNKKGLVKNHELVTYIEAL